MARAKPKQTPPPTAPRVGETVLFHDTRDAKVYPAIVCHVDANANGEARLDLCVLRPTNFNVSNAPGDFGHWGPLR